MNKSHSSAFQALVSKKYTLHIIATFVNNTLDPFPFWSTLARKLMKVRKRRKKNDVIGYFESSKKLR